MLLSSLQDDDLFQGLDFKLPNKMLEEWRSTLALEDIAEHSNTLFNSNGASFIADGKVSPLRPGVYVGIGTSNEPRVLQKVPAKHPLGLPTSAVVTEAPPRAVPVLVPKPNKGTATWNRSRLHEGRIRKSDRLHEVKVEDKEVVEQRSNYMSWKKKVVECTRALELEVNRFRMEN